jgi:hypothetical protein
VAILVKQGLKNIEGFKIGTLTVGDMVARRPEPRYTVTCSLCGTSTVYSHSTLLLPVGPRCGRIECALATERKELENAGRVSRRN